MLRLQLEPSRSKTSKSLCICDQRVSSSSQRNLLAFQSPFQGPLPAWAIGGKKKEDDKDKKSASSTKSNDKNAKKNNSKSTKGEPVEEQLVEGKLNPVLEVLGSTANAFLNGGLFGAFFGFISGMASKRNFKLALGEAKSQGQSWGSVSAIYTGLQVTARVLRGGQEDKWNSVVGACGSGAFFSIREGPKAMIQGCVTFAGFSYFVEQFLFPQNKPEDSDENQIEEKLLYAK